MTDIHGGRIDVHQHVFPDRYLKTLTAHGVDNAGGRLLPAWSVPAAIDLMDEHGIERSVVSISAPGVWFGDDVEAARVARDANDDAATVAADHPRRFAVFASLPLPDVDASLRELAYAFDELGASGVVVMTNVGGIYWGDPRYGALYEELDRRGAVVFIHPASPQAKPDLPISDATLEFVYDTGRVLVNLAYRGVIERFPGIRFIASHAGGVVPFLGTRIDRGWYTREDALTAAPHGPLAALRTVYYDNALSVSPATMRALVEFAGESQVLFGSDFPFVAAPAVRRYTAELDQYLREIPAATAQAILKGNALRLFGSSPATDRTGTLAPEGAHTP